MTKAWSTFLGIKSFAGEADFGLTGRALDTTAGDRGSRNEKVEPAPGVLETSTRPPCSSTNVLTSHRPRPMPRLPNSYSPDEWRSVSNPVKNGSKRCC